jgi:hypothetical protein
MVQAHHALQSGASCSLLSGRDLAFVVIKSDVGQSMALRAEILSEQADPAAKIEQRQLCVGNRCDRGGIDWIVGQLAHDIAALQPAVIQPGDPCARGSIHPGSTCRGRRKSV